MKKGNSKILFGMRYLQLKRNDLKVFGALLYHAMTIKSLIKATRLSERTLRTCLNSLISKNFIKRKVVSRKRLKYMYYIDKNDTTFDSIIKWANQIKKK